MTQDLTSPPPIRVLVVDDSAFMRTALTRMIASEPGFDVVGTACSGVESLGKIADLDPDVVTLDIEMPGLNGLGTLRRIMTQFPRPVIMVSAATENDADVTFNALSSGAFDYIPKQLSSASLDILHIREDLLAKIRAAAQSRHSPRSQSATRKPAQCHSRVDAAPSHSASPAIVALGTSTGGPKALQEILPLFPADLSVPILIVQHMPLGFTAPFAQRLNSLCALAICEAQHGQPIQPGVAYIAPAGQHMTVERRSGSTAVIGLDSPAEKCLHVPSVDVMMKSVATAYGNRALGVILTGMGSDGADGMQAIYRQGGLTIGQDEHGCAVYGMPRACAERGILSRVLPLAEIPGHILQVTRQRKRA